MHLLDLPADIVALFPDYLHNIEDFTNASSACVALRAAFSTTRPNQILRLAAASRLPFFRPQPHFLIAATARQLSEWAIQTPENTTILRNAFKGGIGDLLQLCLDKAGLTMDGIQKLRTLRLSTLNPIADLAIRTDTYRRFMNPRSSYTGRVDCGPTTAIYQMIIYGELFASTVDACLNPRLGLPKFDLDTRLDYVRYCIPDWFSEKGATFLPPAEPVGPYHPDNQDHLHNDQLTIQTLLNTQEWLSAFRSAGLEVEPNLGDDNFWNENVLQHRPSTPHNNSNMKWRLWWIAIQTQGFPSVEIMRPDGVGKWMDRIVELRAQVEALETMPTIRRIGNTDLSDCPNLYREVSMFITAGFG